MVHRLVAKFDLPSYLPKPDEILDGVQWLRENPALAAGVMVGLTSYSVATYYQLVAGSDDDDDDSDDDEVTREEIARSISAIQLGLLKVGLRGTSASTETVDSLASTSSAVGSLRRRTSSVFRPVIEVRPAPGIADRKTRHGAHSNRSCLYVLGTGRCARARTVRLLAPCACRERRRNGHKAVLRPRLGLVRADVTAVIK